MVLNINSHKPDRLDTVKERDITHLQHFLKHGFVSFQRVKTGDDESLKNKPLRAYDSLEPEEEYDLLHMYAPKAKRQSVKQVVNGKDATHRQRRNRAWELQNHRPKSEWQHWDKVKKIQNVKADMIRDRNYKDVYGNP